MIKTTKIILIVCLSIIFIILGTNIVLYSQGYRIDFSKHRLIKTGGIFVQTNPKGVEVYLNDKFIKKTDAFWGSILIKNILPKKYKLTIKKEGYFPYTNEIEVEEKKVASENIVLFLENFPFNLLAKDVNDYIISPDNKKIVFEEWDGKNWEIKLFDLERKVAIHLISEPEVGKGTIDFVRFQWDKNSKKIYLDLGIKEQEKNFYLDLEKTPYYLIEKKKEIPDNIIAYEENNGIFYYLNSRGDFLKGNYFSSTSSISLIKEKFPVKKETKYEIKIINDFVFLIEEDTPYILNTKDNIFEKFFDKVDAWASSPDKKTIAFGSNTEVWLWDTVKNEKVFLTRFSEKIKNIFWLNSDYLILSAGDSIKIIGKNKDKLNVYNYNQFKNPIISWNEKEKNLLIFSDNKFYLGEKILP